jgi:hypothetical protein
MSEGKRIDPLAEAARLVQAVVDSMPMNEQVFRTGSLGHKEETCKYIRHCLRRLGYAPEALPGDEYLYATFSRALLEGVRPQLHAIEEKLSEGKNSGEVDTHVLERAQGVIRAVHPRKPKLFSDWLAFYDVTMADLAEHEHEYEYMYRLFMRASELESRANEDWSERSLLERAEFELFQDTSMWMGYMSAAGKELAHTSFAHRPFSGTQAVFESAAELIASNLHYYLRITEDGVPLYKRENGVLIEISPIDRLGVMARAALQMGTPDAYREPPEWASLLYQRYFDIYCHDLIAGDVWSPSSGYAEDPVRMYSDGTTPAKKKKRDQLVADQKNLRRAALRAAINGRLEVPPLAVKSGSTFNRAEAHSSRSLPLARFAETCAACGVSPEQVKAGATISNYLADLFERAAEAICAPKDLIDVRSLKEIAESELWSGNLWAHGETWEDRVRDLYRSAAQQLAGSINARCYDWRHGLPLYEKDANGTLKALGESHGLGLHLSLLLRDGAEPSRCYQMSSWASDVFVRQSDQEAFNLFFSDGGFTGEAAKVRKAALTLYLGGTLVTDQPSSSAIEALTNESEALRAELARLQADFEEFRERAIDPYDLEPNRERAAERISAIIRLWRAATEAQAKWHTDDRRCIADPSCMASMKTTAPPRIAVWMDWWLRQQYVKDIKEGTMLFGVSMEAIVKACNWDGGGALRAR